jgi:hypothetical protein
VQQLPTRESNHPAGEPRTCAIPFDCLTRDRKQRANCRRAVTLSGARVKNVATLRKSAENRDVLR